MLHLYHCCGRGTRRNNVQYRQGVHKSLPDTSYRFHAFLHVVLRGESVVACVRQGGAKCEQPRDEGRRSRFSQSVHGEARCCGILQGCHHPQGFTDITVRF
ncbi:hypothetical protein E2C01_093129 [Portunus trituberculatus]|uniref:Uncharacterized protein n=1 Tax=Portunus trituberculatus TaxID=210409 RepID=A0A5B7JXA9_PORTR|nr:hypothetical protein [Portunus trituberculatus]